MRDSHSSDLFSYETKPGLQVAVREAMGKEAEQNRVEDISRIGRLFDKAMEPRLSTKTRINYLYIVRKKYVDAGLTKWLAPEVSRVIAIEKKKLK